MGDYRTPYYCTDCSTEHSAIEPCADLAILSDEDICACGHEWHQHVDLPGFPGGCQECQVGDCGCGQFRHSRRYGRDTR